jgi:KaiC/GvpD/RAD55 family RecA-like ATPase
MMGDSATAEIERACEGVDDEEIVDPLETIDARDLLGREIRGTPFVVEHLFPEEGLVLFTGESGSGKTAFALHAASAVAFGLPVGGRFATLAPGGPVFYLNGELPPSLLQNVLRASVAGLGESIDAIPLGALLFEGSDGMATIRFRANHSDIEQRRRFISTMERHRPKLVFLDTQRALFDLDEKEALQVRPELDWLRQIARRFKCCIVLLHHLRKQSAVSNAARERVSGSSDLIANVDVHIQGTNAVGRFMKSLYFDKTRYPRGPYRAGVRCQVEATFEPPSDVTGQPGRSSFVVGGPDEDEPDLETETAAQRDIIARLTSEGPLTRNQIGAGENASGNMRRAFKELDKRRRIVKTGQRAGRSELWSVKPTATLFNEPGPDDEARLGPPGVDDAQRAVNTDFEPGPFDKARLGPEDSARQTERRFGDPALRRGPVPESTGSTNRASGPNPIRGPRSKGPGSCATHKSARAGGEFAEPALHPSHLSQASSDVSDAKTERFSANGQVCTRCKKSGRVRESDGWCTYCIDAQSEQTL